jgi:hypothetical protein
MAQSKHEPEDFCQGMDDKAGVGEGHCGCIETLEVIEKLFAAGTEGIPRLTDANERNFVYDAMNGAHDRAVKAIQALHMLPKNTRDAAPLEELKSVVLDAWGNVNYAVREFFLSEADPQVVTAQARLTEIATLVQAMQRTLNMRAQHRDEESLKPLFERCTYNLEKPSAERPREAYAILDAMRKEAWDYLQNAHQKEGAGPTLNAIFVTLDRLVSTASAALDALDPEAPDKAQALANHAAVHRALDRIRERQAERQRQDSSDPMPSMCPAERPAPRVHTGAPQLVHQHAQICALLAQLERASWQ